MMTIPYLSRKQMILVDKLMMDEYHIDLLQMMENVGRALCGLAIERYQLKVGSHILVLAGSGGNGGGVLVAARRLHCLGMNIQIALSSEKLKPVSAHQLSAVRKLEIPIINNDLSDVYNKPILVIDGIIGYSLNGAVKGVPADLINRVNANDYVVFSLDCPSGLDVDKGKIYSPLIKADATMTLALPKKGLINKNASCYVGELFLADIGVPPKLYAEKQLGFSVGNLFYKNEIIKIN